MRIMLLLPQVYASYKYPRTDIHRLRPGKLMQQATDFTPNMLSSPDTGESRRVGPFHMKPATAIRSATHKSALRAVIVLCPEQQSSSCCRLQSSYSSQNSLVSGFESQKSCLQQSLRRHKMLVAGL